MNFQFETLIYSIYWLRNLDSEFAILIEKQNNFHDEFPFIILFRKPTKIFTLVQIFFRFLVPCSKKKSALFMHFHTDTPENLLYKK